MRWSRRQLPGLFAALAGCAADRRPAADGSGWIRLPADAGTGLLTDADRRAAFHIAATLTAPSRQAGDPAAEARALGYYEFATVALAGPRWAGLDPLAVIRLRQGRTELRTAFGLKQDAPAQLVVDAFFAAAAALSVGDEAGAAHSFPPALLTVPPKEVLARLQDPPHLREVAWASAGAAAAINQLDGSNRYFP